MSRLYYLDAMRSVLMMLGIVLHAAVIFGNKSWLIMDNDASAIYDVIIEFIHLFRMPAFFIVSGFFCYMTLNRYGAKLFLKVRIPRILIPLIITALTLNSLQNIILSDYRPLAPFIFSIEYMLQGIWVSHLWFLISLIYYFIFSAVVYFFFRSTIDKLLVFISRIYLRSGAISLILLSLSSLLAMKASYLVDLIFPDGQFDWVLGNTIRYSVYFFFGFLACHNRSILEKFSQLSYLVLVLTILALCSAYWLLGFLPESIYNTLNLFIVSLWIWLLCCFCFILFKLLTNKSSRVFSYFSGASYSIYLFHHVLIIFYATILNQLNLPYGLMYILLVFITFLSTMIIHHFIVLRFSIIKFLFNGK